MRFDRIAAQEMGLSREELEEKGIVVQFPQTEPQQPITSLHNIEKAVKKWLILDSTDIVRVLLGTVVANKLKGDPVWLFVIAPPSSAKTELIRALDEIPETHPLSDLTAQTLISGMKGPDRSLLPKLNNKILTLKDFTTVLTMNRDTRQAILSQLREIADGSYVKSWGTGKELKWRGKVGFIAGVTQVIDTHYAVYQVLGERFVQYRLAEPDSRLVVRKARENAGKETKMRQELRDIFTDFIGSLEIPRVEEIKIGEEVGNKFDSLIQFCVIARSGVIRDSYGSKEIVYIPDPEGPARLAKQLATLGKGLALVRGSPQVAEEDYGLLYKIGLDGILRQRMLTINALNEADDQQTTTQIAKTIQYPTNTTRRFLEDLTAFKLVSRDPQGQGKADLWGLSEKCKNLLEETSPNSPENSFFDL